MKEYLSLALVSLMSIVALGTMVLVYCSSKEKTKNNVPSKSKVRFTLRGVQFLSVGLALPLIALLALNELLAKDAVGPLLGALLGYVLSGMEGKKE